MLNPPSDDGYVITLQEVELGVLGPLQVRQYGLPVAIPGAKPRAILTMLGLYGGSVVSADALVKLLWGDDPPRTATKALQTHISSLRRTLGDGFVLTEGTGWTLSTAEVDAIRYKTAAKLGRKALTAGDPTRAVALFDQALALWRGIPELPDSSRGSSEKTRWLEGHAALVEDRADALLATGRAAEIVGELESAIAEAPLRERRWGHLMLALYRAGRQGEALGAYKRARSLLAEELGVDPGPELRRLEAAIVAQDAALELPQSQQLSTVTRAVTFLLTDIEGSTAAWEADADAMAVALARHDEIVEQVVTSRGGRLIKTRGEGDATFSVFDRPSAAAAAAIELQEAIGREAWQLANPMRIRVALHTGEVEFRDGDYFGRAVNRAARLRSLATGGQILCSGATAELVIDSLPDDVVLTDLGTRRLRNLPRPEHVFELRMQAVDDTGPPGVEVPIERPALPAVLVGPGPFVGRHRELERLVAAWQSTLASGTRAVLIAGEPGVGKTRLAGEWSRHAYEQGAVVLYGRCDEDLGAPYQPFAEALRSLVSCVDSTRLRNVRGVEALLPLIPGLADALPDLVAPPRADPDTERYALFDAVVALLGAASATVPLVLILDDLHWAAKPTLLLLRHLLRFGEEARVQIIGTYRSTDLDRAHPLAAMLADLHRDGTATRLQLGGLDEGDVTAYVAEAGYDDEELGRALATVTGGNPFFLIEALRHVEESGGRWDPSTLPQGVREAVSRRLSRLTTETNKALAAAAVVGSRFALTLVEQVVGADLVDAFDEAGKAGIVIEEPGGRYRFNHALVRQSLLAELPSVRRMRLHQRIAGTLEGQAGVDDEVLAELAYHYFECAWAGNAAKAVEYCRRAADQAMSRVAYEGAAELYDRALHALEELDDELPDRDDLQAELLIAHCEALLAAGDVASAKDAVMQLRAAAGDSGRLGAWGVCFDGELSMLTDPERLDEIESSVSGAAERLAGLKDAAGEAKAHTVRAGCLARLGRIGDCETALDQALTAARRAQEHGRVNAVLAGAPLAALWGPNPVPRAGGRCLDVVRLLRITTGSPLVEATSTRCQAVLDAFRGRAAEGRRLIESARRTLTELGLRHALLEVDQFAGIIELVADDPAAAEPYLRRAYEGFRRMGLDTDTADTAALLARACLALDRDSDADELCSESERLAGHGSKASIAWRTVRARLLARDGAHDRARRVAEEAVDLAGATDALVDHGDACLALATVLRFAGNTAGMRAAAEQAVALYDRKGAAALAEKARGILGTHGERKASAEEQPADALTNACVQVGERAINAINHKAWEEYERLFAPEVFVESRRRIVGFTRDDLQPGDWAQQNRHIFETSGNVRLSQSVIAVRGARLALSRLSVGSTDTSPGAPRDEFLQIYGIDDDGRVSLQLWFDVDDLDAALAELDAVHSRLTERRQLDPLENAATRADDRAYALYVENRLDEIGALLAEDYLTDDRRQGLRRVSNDRATALDNIRAIAAVGPRITSTPIALRGDRLCLSHTLFEDRQRPSDAFRIETLDVLEIDDNGQMTARIVFDLHDIDAAIAELNTRYSAGEAEPFAQTWSAVTELTAAFNRHDFSAVNCPSTDHRRLTRYARGDLTPATLTQREFTPDLRTFIEVVHRLSDRGVVITNRSLGTARGGFEAEWRVINILLIEHGQLKRYEIFDETDIDAALTRFDQLTRPTPRLENSATRVHARMEDSFANRDWDAARMLMAEDVSVDDRHRVVSSEVRRGPEATIANMQAGAQLGAKSIASVVFATRGDRLALLRTRYEGKDTEPEAFHMDDLTLVEIGTDDRIRAGVVFDLDDIDSAIAELDSRYIAAEAAPFARTWTVIASAYAGLRRSELAPTTKEWVNVDHRRLAPIAAGRLGAYIRMSQAETPDIDIHVEAVHRLSELGAVVTRAVSGTSTDGFYAEWREIDLLTVDGELISRCEIFDEADLDMALAEFDALRKPQPRLQDAANSESVPRVENMASRAGKRFQACYAAGEWSALEGSFADTYFMDDRRRTVNAGVRHGRAHAMEDIQTAVGVGLWANLSSATVATRGRRLALMHFHASGTDPGAIQTDLLQVVEVDDDERFAAVVVFDLNDADVAFEDLERRYLAGEASAHAHTWSVIAGAYAAVRRQELPPTTPDWINVDHRRVTSFAPNDLKPFLQATWDVLTPDLSIYVEAVHRLTDMGAVVTRVIRGTSHEGFGAEWREVGLSTIQGDRINRSELFDEADLDAALARFDELDLPPVLENAASRLIDRYCASFGARDWAVMAELLAEDVITDDRRRVVNAGVRHGRDVQLADSRAAAEVGGGQNVSSTVIATRGERLVLSRVRTINGNTPPGEVGAQMLGIAEIDENERIAVTVAFDDDDLDAAFQELDARYSAGEASAYSRAWAAISATFAAVNRGELPDVTPDCITLDHRRAVAFAPGELGSYTRAAHSNTADLRAYIEAVHRLNVRGAVVSYVAKGASNQGFQAEWRGVSLSTVEDGLVNRNELFDEADLDAALARFDELNRSASRSVNAAYQMIERLWNRFAERDWTAMEKLLAVDICAEDRRRIVNDGLRRGRDAFVANMRAVADVGIDDVTSTVVATRGQRLVLARVCTERFHSGVLNLVELDSEQKVMTSTVVFDVEDLGAAFVELERRYLAGEASGSAQTWSVIAQGYAAANRGEVAVTAPNVVNVDHRRLPMINPGALIRYLRDIFDELDNIKTYVEAVHKLTPKGAVVTHVGFGTSREGFDGEWRMINVLVVEGGVINRSDLFDEQDLDAALARFEELDRPAPRLSNAATQLDQRFRALFAQRDWEAMAAIYVENIHHDDRRRVVGAGALHGRDATIANFRATADMGTRTVTSTVVATRGQRLALSAVLLRGRDQRPEAFQTEALVLVEVTVDNRIAAEVVFDADDMASALRELDSRYVAGEAAAHAHTWSLVTRTYAAFNRHELSPTTEDWVNIDHRPGIGAAPGDMHAYVTQAWEVATNITTRIEAVYRLSDTGAVFSHVESGTSDQGFNAEWREVSLLTFEGDAINRCEIFDETDLDAAIAKFDDLDPRSTRIESATTRMWASLADAFNRRDLDGYSKLLTPDGQLHDHRKGLHALIDGPERRAHARLMFELTPHGWRMEVEPIAVRGSRLSLARTFWVDGTLPEQPITNDLLAVVETSSNGLIQRIVAFDADDIASALEELESRYVAGEAAALSRTWTAVTRAYASFNRREVPTTTPAWVDHRLLATIQPADLIANVHAAWDLVPDIMVHIAAVHRITEFGAVVELVVKGTSQDGFYAEYHEIAVVTVAEDVPTRFEMFDVAQLDAALERLDELSRSTWRPENAASQAVEQFCSYFVTRNWTDMAQILGQNVRVDDRRRVVGAGVRQGREGELENLRTWADIGVEDFAADPIAIRGEHLALCRARWAGANQHSKAFQSEALGVVEVDADNQIAARVMFDSDDIDSALAELEARYLAGDAATHARTWSAIAEGYATFNRRELFNTTSDWVNIDHRRGGTAFAPGEQIAYVNATWDLVPKIHAYPEVVHRLDALGAVFTQIVKATSQEGFDGEWREITLLTIEGDAISRCEMFDEGDLNAALVRFDELNRSLHRLANAATRTRECAMDRFSRRDVDGFCSYFASDGRYDDRRKGLRSDGFLKQEFAPTVLSEAPESWRWTNEPVAIRGQRLALCRDWFRDNDAPDRPVKVDDLSLTEVTEDGLICHSVIFDRDDLDAAMRELDDRWIASGEVTHPEIIEAARSLAEATNRHDWEMLVRLGADATYANHRQLSSPDIRTLADHVSSIKAMASLVPDFWIEHSEVLAYSGAGLVSGIVLRGTSTDGFSVEIPIVMLTLFDGDRLTRFEVFDPEDRNLALARFEELNASG